MTLVERLREQAATDEYVGLEVRSRTLREAADAIDEAEAQWTKWSEESIRLEQRLEKAERLAEGRAFALRVIARPDETREEPALTVRDLRAIARACLDVHGGWHEIDGQQNARSVRREESDG